MFQTFNSVRWRSETIGCGYRWWNHQKRQVLRLHHAWRQASRDPIAPLHTDMYGGIWWLRVWCGSVGQSAWGYKSRTNQQSNTFIILKKWSLQTIFIIESRSYWDESGRRAMRCESNLVSYRVYFFFWQRVLGAVVVLWIFIEIKNIMNQANLILQIIVIPKVSPFVNSLYGPQQIICSLKKWYLGTLLNKHSDFIVILCIPFFVKCIYCII